MSGVHRPSPNLSLSVFALAVLGAFVAFLPLIQVLLPIKAAQIAPQAPVALLGRVAAVGAVVAGAANLGVGWLSDRTRGRWGRRRPWIVAGLGGVLASDALLAQARSGAVLLAGMVCFQLAVNALLAPLLALVPDRVPAAARGRASAVVALGSPLGTLVGIGGLGLVPGGIGLRFACLGAAVLLLVLPLCLTLGDDPPAGAPAPSMPAAGRPDGAGGRTRIVDFALGGVARGCVLFAFAIAQTCLFFYVAGIDGHGGPAAARGVALLGLVFGVASAITALTLGHASDRAGRRKPFVVAGALLVAAGMAGLALARSWPAVVASYGVFSVGAGAHMAVEFALIVDILPSRNRAARDLGLLNIANVAPQVVAPLGLAWLSSWPGADVHWGFAAGAVAAALGAASVAAIRSAA